MTADEPTAIRHPRRGKAHRYRMSSTTWCGQQVGYMTERLPLSQIPTTDLCRTCWPTTKEQNA